MIKKEYLALFTSVFSVSFAAILIVSCSAPSISISFYRMLFTTLLIIPLLFLGKNKIHEIKKIPKKNLYIMIGIGVVLAAHFLLWITSLKLTSVASSVILVTAHPVLVGPFAHFFMKEKLSIINTIGIAISVIGVIILVYGNYGFTSMGIDTLEGNILALLGGIAAGIYILGGRRIRKTVSVTSYATIVYSVATLVLFIITLIYGLISQNEFFNVELRDLGIILLMAIIAGIFGHTLYNWSLKHVRASLASVSLLGEPIGSTTLALMLPWIQQIPSEYTILGGSFILSGIYLNTRKNKK